MIIPFKLSPQMLFKSGYSVKQGTHEREFIKSINGRTEYPRYHLTLKDDTCDLHIDQKKMHGSFMTWLYGTKKNVTKDGKQVYDEAAKISLDYVNELIERNMEVLERSRETIHNVMKLYNKH